MNRQSIFFTTAINFIVSIVLAILSFTALMKVNQENLK